VAGCYACPVLRLYQFGSVRFLKCNHKVTGNGCAVTAVKPQINHREVVDGCKAEIGIKAENQRVQFVREHW